MLERTHVRVKCEPSTNGDRNQLEGGDPVAYQERHTERHGVGARARWLVVALVVIAIAVAIVLIALYTGGSGGGGGGGGPGY